MSLPIDWIAISAALLAGLTGGVHCVAMCGGIATGFSAMQAMQPTTRLRSLLQAAEPNLGRISGYTLAGLLAGGLGGGIVQLARSPWLSFGLRMALGVLLLLVALRLFGIGILDKLNQRPATALWQHLRPLHSKLIPANSHGKRLLLGVLWGWLPCGLSLSILSVAWLSADARNGALIMLAFGVGTLPVMVPLTWAGVRLFGGLQNSRWRYGAALLLLMMALVTFAAPWLMHVPALHGPLAALGCLPAPLAR